MSPRKYLGALALVLFAACGSSGKTAVTSPGADGASEASASGADAAPLLPDAGADLAADVAADLAPDLAADVAPDLATDVAPDLAADLAPDLAADLGADLAADLASPADAADGSAADVREARPPEPLLLIQPTSVMFAAVVGRTSPAVRMFLANAGGAATGALTITLGGTSAQDFAIRNNTCLAPLAPLKTCDFDLVVMASTPGTKTATVTASSLVGGMAVATLSAVVDAAAQLTVTPTMLAFGNIAAGATSLAQTIEVKNTGGATTSVLTATSTTGEFVITANTCGGATLSPNATCTVSVAFKPISQGQKSAVVSVSGYAGENVQVGVTGNGS
jgi:hypothetical protein